MARLVSCVMSLCILMGAHINAAESRVFEGAFQTTRWKMDVRIVDNQYKVQYTRAVLGRSSTEHNYCFTREELEQRLYDHNAEDARVFTRNSVEQGFLRDVSKSQGGRRAL